MGNNIDYPTSCQVAPVQYARGQMTAADVQSVCHPSWWALHGHDVVVIGTTTGLALLAVAVLIWLMRTNRTPV